MGTNFYCKYLDGNHIEVWKEICDIDYESQQEEIKQDIISVLIETTNRIEYNINLIFSHLIKSNYAFFNIKDNVFLPTNMDKIKKLDTVIFHFGCIPLSLKYFYQRFTKINFINSWNISPHLKYSDPIFIDSIDNILNNINDGSWEENMSENQENGDPLYVEISPDLYHKDNVSGDLPYGIEISTIRHVDGKILNTPYGDIYFIEYLRLCFERGGFPNIQNGYNSRHNEFIEKIKYDLKQI